MAQSEEAALLRIVVVDHEDDADLVVILVVLDLVTDPGLNEARLRVEVAQARDIASHLRRKLHETGEAAEQVQGPWDVEMTPAPEVRVEIDRIGYLENPVS